MFRKLNNVTISGVWKGCIHELLYNWINMHDASDGNQYVTDAPDKYSSNLGISTWCAWIESGVDLN